MINESEGLDIPVDVGVALAAISACASEERRVRDASIATQDDQPLVGSVVCNPVDGYVGGVRSSDKDQ